MDLLIKDIPENCHNCRFCREQEYGEYVHEDFGYVCAVSGNRIFDFTQKSCLPWTTNVDDE